MNPIQIIFRKGSLDYCCPKNLTKVRVQSPLKPLFESLRTFISNSVPLCSVVHISACYLPACIGANINTVIIDTNYIICSEVTDLYI